MTNTVRTALIVSASAVGTGIISAVSYLKGKQDGLKLAAKQHADLLATANAPVHSGNRRVDQAQA